MKHQRKEQGILVSLDIAVVVAMDIDEIRRRFEPAVNEIIDTCCITEDFVDKDRFRVYIATIWGNAVLQPEKSGIDESDLSNLHDFLNEEIEKLLGTDQTITSCFEYLVTKAGDDSMNRLQVNNQHKDFIHYFARLILGSDSLSNINLSRDN
ncbi:MAG TPA: hypothetical protein EYQ14_23535 [Gammaproteobacteria bacterium]|nr:hypothetical protein [Gammaproteobacteria bacterium]HIL96331.1 hypothetical protein [Pseudomonadales bacterium]